MIDKDKVLYLAVPYTPTEKQVSAQMPLFIHLAPEGKVKAMWAFLKDKIMHERAREADRAAAWLILRGYTVLSPISHSHGIAQHMAPQQRVDHELWMRQDAPFVRAADVMLILTLDGWRESRGIKHEIREFTVHKRDWYTGRNVFFLNRTHGGYEISRRPG